MGYWTDTTFILNPDARAVAAALTELLEAEGMRSIPRPAPRDRARYEPMQYAGGPQNNLWALALFPGASGWTVIKSAPLELLAERPAPDRKMRLVSLCELLKSPGGMLNVYDSSAGNLLETDGEGRLTMSGYALESDQNPDPQSFYGEPVSMDRLSIDFHILPLAGFAKPFEDAFEGQRLVDNEALAQALEAALGGTNAELCSNLTSVDTLVCHKPLRAAGGIELYFEWPARDRDERPPK